MIITVSINVLGYLRLPDEIATQISLTGGSVNRMPTAIYLTGSFVLIAIFALLTLRNEREQRIKYFLVNTILTVANIIMIAIQI